MLKHQETYEIIKPEVVGLIDHNNMVLGKLSGMDSMSPAFGLTTFVGKQSPVTSVLMGCSLCLGADNRSAVHVHRGQRRRGEMAMK